MDYVVRFRIDQSKSKVFKYKLLSRRGSNDENVTENQDAEETSSNRQSNQNGGTYLDQIIEVPEAENEGFSFKTLWAFTGNLLSHFFWQKFRETNAFTK